MSYTQSKAQNALGTTIGIGATPTIIGEVTSIKQSGAKNELEEVTNLQSTAKEWIGTLPDPGEWQIEGNRVSSDAGQVAVETAFASAATSQFTIQLPKTGSQTTGDKYTFNGIVVERDFSFDTGKKMPFTAKIKVTGSITFTQGS
jgi:hypothetical protein